MVQRAATAATNGGLVMPLPGWGAIRVPITNAIQAPAPNSVDDTSALQASINTAAGQSGGGAVELKAGTYKVSASLTLPAGVHLLGVGQGNTTIQAIAAITGAIIQAPTTTQVIETGIRGLTCDGNSHSTYCIDASYIANATIEDINCIGATSHGFYVAPNVTPPGLIIRNLRCASNGGDGCHIATSNGTQISQGYSLSNTGSGLYLSGGETEIWGWEADQDGDRGIIAVSANRTALIGCAVSQNVASSGASIEIRTSNDCKIVGCRILAPATFPFNYPAYYFVSSDHCTLTGSVIISTAAVSNIAAGVWVSAASHHITVTSCVIQMTHGQAIYEEAGAANTKYTSNILDAPTAPTLTGGTTAQNVGFNPQGFSTATPGVPSGTGSGNAVTNTNPYSVLIYLDATQNGVHIIDASNNDKALPAAGAGVVRIVQLSPSDKIYFATAVPLAWLWYGL